MSECDGPCRAFAQGVASEKHSSCVKGSWKGKLRLARMGRHITWKACTLGTCHCHLVGQLFGVSIALGDRRKVET